MRRAQGDGGLPADPAALETLLRRHQDRLYTVCRRLVGSDQDAADACQEALIAVVRGLSGFDGRASFATWSYRVATNSCLDELRRRRRQPPIRPFGSDDFGSGPSGSGPSGSAPVETATPDRTDEVGTRLDLDTALASLPAEFRLAVVLRDVCDLSYAEIATVTGAPLGTVRSRIARGRSALVPLLGDQGN